MSRLAYLAVLMVVLGSVVFGLDWQPAPMSPMPDLKIALPSSAVVAPNRPEPPNVVLSPAYPISPIAPAPAAGQQTRGFVQPVPPLAQQPVAAVASNCNVDACTAAYRSFQAADCSYQPSNGPRRRCTKR